MFLQSFGIAGSGFNDWDNARKILLNEQPFNHEKNKPSRIRCLKPNEARRISQSIRLALLCVEQSLDKTSLKAGQLYSIFTSSDGDPRILQSICQALATEDKFVSPTQFHNSVHNAPAGYWSIGHQCMKGSNSIACGRCNISGALIEADSLLNDVEQSVLLSCFDIESPSPLDSARKIGHSLAFSMIATQQKNSESEFHLDMQIIDFHPANLSILEQPALEQLRNDSATTRALPFLQALADKSREAQSIILPYSDRKALQLELQAC